MATVTIIPAKGNAIQFPVSDKSDAIRKISSRLLKIFDKEYVEKSLNVWLKQGMERTVRLGHDNERFTITYQD